MNSVFDSICSFYQQESFTPITWRDAHYILWSWFFLRKNKAFASVSYKFQRMWSFDLGLLSCFILILSYICGETWEIFLTEKQNTCRGKLMEKRSITWKHFVWIHVFNINNGSERFTCQFYIKCFILSWNSLWLKQKYLFFITFSLNDCEVCLACNT